MIIYGASGHGKVVKSASREAVTFFIDDNPKLINFSGLPVHRYQENFESSLPLVVAVGNNKIRKSIVEKVRHSFTNVISDTAILDSSIILGHGNQILHGAILQADTVLGNHCILNSGSSVDHDCVLSDYCHIAPNATLCGNVNIGEGSLIGAGAVVIPGVNIGKWCTIGAGSVVINNVPDYSTVVGNPGKIIKKHESR